MKKKIPATKAKVDKAPNTRVMIEKINLLFSIGFVMLTSVTINRRARYVVSKYLELVQLSHSLSVSSNILLAKIVKEA